MSPANTETPRLLRLPEVTRLTSLGRSAIYARVAAGTFPMPLSVSSRCTVWRESEVRAWIDSLPRGVGPRPGSAAAA
jgi:prophage regulatory protein